MDYKYEIVLALVILGLFNDVLSCLAVIFRVTIREKALMAQYETLYQYFL